MLPYTRKEFKGKVYYLHGIPHPAPLFPLKEEFIVSLRNYLNESIRSDNIWYCEDGFDSFFELNDIISITSLEKDVIQKFTFMKYDELVRVEEHILKNLLKLRENLPPRQLFAESMTSIEDLPNYRRMFRAPAKLILEIDDYNIGKKANHYNNLINRCNKEKQVLIGAKNLEIHYLCGIAHEFILARIQW